MKVPLLHVSPIGFRQASLFIALNHRHHRATVGCKFALSVVDEGKIIRGVALCGRPAARFLDDGDTLEVVRVCTDGTRNACSMLYGACRRTAWAMGYGRLITYTLPEEGGASLKAAGFVRTAETEGRSWSRPGRNRTDKHPISKKWRWESRRQTHNREEERANAPH